MTTVRDPDHNIVHVFNIIVNIPLLFKCFCVNETGGQAPTILHLKKHGISVRTFIRSLNVCANTFVNIECSSKNGHHTAIPRQSFFFP